eukprot:scaffold135465_cov33-Prasinocladus_malaysianus.AAC.2
MAGLSEPGWGRGGLPRPGPVRAGRVPAAGVRQGHRPPGLPDPRDALRERPRGDDGSVQPDHLGHPAQPAAELLDHQVRQVLHRLLLLAGGPAEPCPPGGQSGQSPGRPLRHDSPAGLGGKHNKDRRGPGNQAVLRRQHQGTNTALLLERAGIETLPLPCFKLS